MPRRTNLFRLAELEWGRYRYVPLLIPLLCAFATFIATFAVSPVHSHEDKQDRRQAYDETSPDWLRAVGKLQVHGSRYHNGQRTFLIEECSATLVSSDQGKSADTIVTAWHCLAHYNDLSKPITFTLTAGQNDTIFREAYRLADGGGMFADWAILRLRKPVSELDAKALSIHPKNADPDSKITMAGFSRKTALGDFANHLTFDPSCSITANGNNVNDSDCLAYKGASGGAVVQLSDTGDPFFVGVISEGDSLSLSRFVPVSRFRNALRLQLGERTTAR